MTQHTAIMTESRKRQQKSRWSIVTRGRVSYLLRKCQYGRERRARKKYSRCSILHWIGPEPDTVIVVSTHSVMYADYFHISPGSGSKGKFCRFRASQVEFQAGYATEFAWMLCRKGEARDIPAGTVGERDKSLDHETMVSRTAVDGWESRGTAVVCTVCLYYCRLTENQYGRCIVRKNEKEEIICDNYGIVTALALDSIVSVSFEIVLNVTRFFPRYRMTDRKGTDVKEV